MDESETVLKFNIYSDSFVEVIFDESYCDLQTVTIPAKVRINGVVYEVSYMYDAFSKCVNLTSVKMVSTIRMIRKRSFIDCSNLSYIEVLSDNPDLSSINGVVYNKNQTCIYYVPL